eukprot:scaffold8452_cov185-Ochromonas_danica.AAC.30
MIENSENASTPMQNSHPLHASATHKRVIYKKEAGDASMQQKVKSIVNTEIHRCLFFPLHAHTLTSHSGCGVKFTTTQARPEKTTAETGKTKTRPATGTPSARISHREVEF